MIKPFKSGSEFTSWEEQNCALCSKSFENNPEQWNSGESLCDLDQALTEAYMGDGTITQEQYDRLGLPGTCTELSNI